MAIMLLMHTHFTNLDTLWSIPGNGGLQIFYLYPFWIPRLSFKKRALESRHAPLHVAIIVGLTAQGQQTKLSPSQE
jgi:hypothetical protein